MLRWFSRVSASEEREPKKREPKKREPKERETKEHEPKKRRSLLPHLPRFTSSLRNISYSLCFIIALETEKIVPDFDLIPRAQDRPLDTRSVYIHPVCAA